MDKEYILKLFGENRLDEAADALEACDDAWALYMLGRIAWRRERRSEAISYYCRSAEKEPGGPGAMALEQARQIMDFFNKDLYNP